MSVQDHLVKPPLHLAPPHTLAPKELQKGLLRHVNGLLGTAHALVADDGRDGLAAVGDGDGLAAHGVAVGLLAHHEVGEGDDVLRVVLAAVVEAAGAQAEGVEG